MKTTRRLIKMIVRTKKKKKKKKKNKIKQEQTKALQQKVFFRP